MNQKTYRLSTAEFAKLHGVNKRTLHYYDAIGLFVPRAKGENKYRYYDSSQSMEFEYIRMLKELNMSIEEIKDYVNHPDPQAFIAIADEKTEEIERQIAKLKQTRKLLLSKKEQVILCTKETDMSIHIVECKQEKFFTVPFTFEENDVEKAFSYIKNIWGIEQCRAGVGSYISLSKVQDSQFEKYDGLFTPALDRRQNKDIFIKPRGRYLCGYVKGTWDKLPSMYEKMLKYAASQDLKLTGYAYEKGMNDFAIHNEEDYVTQIMIKIQ